MARRLRWRRLRRWREAARSSLRPPSPIVAASASTTLFLLGSIFTDLPPEMQIPAVIVVYVLVWLGVRLEPGRRPDASPGTLRRTIQSVTERTERVRSRWSRRQRRRRRWGGRTVPVLPPGDSFVGRERELRDLVAWHERLRETQPAGRRRPWFITRSSPGAGFRRIETRPLLLLIHGKPGVGKRAIAYELAQRLAGEYQDGQLYADFRTARADRTPSEVLKGFLEALGQPAHRIPASEVERARRFRSLTRRKKILLLIVGARDAEQVSHVLPTSPNSVVIVTSRRDLGTEPELNYSDGSDPASYHLDTPDELDALTIFRAISRTGESESPICTMRIVRMCDRLPAALRSAAERVANEGTSICSVADLLADDRSRLTWLQGPRPVRALLRAEYDRLLPEEQDAFALLGLLPSRSFLPRVLTPMMQITDAEAEALLARLSTVQLVDDCGTDPPSQLSRYALHGLTRLFAREMAEQKWTEAERARALARLDQLYREVVEQTLSILDPDFQPTQVARRWLPRNSRFPRRVAEMPDRWVRAEHETLIRLITVTGRGTGGDPAQRSDALAWRIAAWLDGRMPADPDVPKIEAAYTEAVEAAQRDQHPVGYIKVLIAKGSFLAAAERYAEARTCLEEAIAAGKRLAASPPAGYHVDWITTEAMVLQARAHRRLGAAYLQATSYRCAIEELRVAEELARDAPNQDEEDIVRILTAEIHGVEHPTGTYEQLLVQGLPEGRRYRLCLAFAEAARRRGDWSITRRRLDQAAALAVGDLGRIATVQYRTARLHLLELAQPDRVRAHPPRPELAIRWAAMTVASYRQLGAPAGVVRASALLARALLAGGFVDEADHVIRAAEADLATFGATSVEAPPLRARIDRARGELLLGLGRVDEARELLMAAATAFRDHRDWSARDAVARLIAAR